MRKYRSLLPEYTSTTKSFAEEHNYLTRPRIEKFCFYHTEMLVEKVGKWISLMFGTSKVISFLTQPKI